MSLLVTSRPINIKSITNFCQQNTKVQETNYQRHAVLVTSRVSAIQYVFSQYFPTTWPTLSPVRMLNNYLWKWRHKKTKAFYSVLSLLEHLRTNCWREYSYYRASWLKRNAARFRRCPIRILAVTVTILIDGFMCKTATKKFLYNIHCGRGSRKRLQNMRNILNCTLHLLLLGLLNHRGYDKHGGESIFQMKVRV
jgi:hypothetical protein